MAAHKIKLQIDQGATFAKTVTWQVRNPPAPAAPVDLTGCVARMQVRQTVASPTVLLELTTENGRIALGDASGTISLRVEAADTQALTWTAGFFDLEIEFADGTVRRLLAGSVTVSPEVTR